MSRTATHDNSDPAIELISVLYKSLYQLAVASSRVDIEMSRHDGHSVEGKMFFVEENEMKNIYKLILIIRGAFCVSFASVFAMCLVFEMELGISVANITEKIFCPQKMVPIHRRLKKNQCGWLGTYVPVSGG